MTVRARALPASGLCKAYKISRHTAENKKSFFVDSRCAKTGRKTMRVSANEIPHLAWINFGFQWRVETRFSLELCGLQNLLQCPTGVAFAHIICTEQLLKIMCIQNPREYHIWRSPSSRLVSKMTARANICENVDIRRIMSSHNSCNHSARVYTRDFNRSLRDSAPELQNSNECALQIWTTSCRTQVRLTNVAVRATRLRISWESFHAISALAFRRIRPQFLFWSV